MKKNCFISILLLLISMSHMVSTVFAQKAEIGTIININLNYRIAFTDILKGQVKVGDIVEIYENNEFVTYLKVIETSNVITKLGFIDQEGLKTDEKDFKRLAIGNMVKAFKKGSQLKSMDAVISQINVLDESNEVLKKEVRKKDAQISKLKKINLKYKKEIKILNQKVSVFKKNLETMAILLDEKISIY